MTCEVMAHECRRRPAWCGQRRPSSHGGSAMRAIVIDHYGGPEVLRHEDLPDPVPTEGDVLIRVHAFGLNHAECYFRSGAWGEVARVTGIEAAGTVEHDPAGTFAPGTRVVAVLGG